MYRQVLWLVCIVAGVRESRLKWSGRVMTKTEVVEIRKVLEVEVPGNFVERVVG